MTRVSGNTGGPTIFEKPWIWESEEPTHLMTRKYGNTEEPNIPSTSEPAKTEKQIIVKNTYNIATIYLKSPNP